MCLSTPGCSSTAHHLSCICLNARSVLPKREDLFAYICAHDPDIMAITETWLDSSIHDSHITPKGYSIFRCDRKRHGGDVLLLIRDTFDVFQ